MNVVRTLRLGQRASLSTPMVSAAAPSSLSCTVTCCAASGPYPLLFGAEHNLERVSYEAAMGTLGENTHCRSLPDLFDV